MTKRIVCLLLGLLLLLTITVPAAAADSAAPEIVQTLMEKFPHRAYWNHVGSADNNPNGVTNTPCPSHVGCSWTPGACSCNSFSNAIQCMGFAYKAAYDLVGSDPRSWEMSTTLDASKLRVGDIIRYRSNRHSLTVTGIRGNVIAFVDCNWYPMCQIRWGSMDLDEMPSFTYVLHDPNNKLKNRNITFFEDEVLRREGDAEAAASKEETWVTTGTMHLRKKASASAQSLCQIPTRTNVVVLNKTLNDGYLWGKVAYGTATGWVALDHCDYVRGTVNAPTFLAFSEIQPAHTAFTLQWSAVKGAESYKVFLYNEKGDCVKKQTVTAPKVTVTLEQTGLYNVEVESHSTHAKSWVLLSEEKTLIAKEPSEIQLESIALDHASLVLERRQTATVHASLTPYCAPASEIFMTSSNSAVATVTDSGIITGISYGITNIICKDAATGLFALCCVRVIPSAPNKFIQYASKIRVDSVTLKWTAVPGADQYLVYRKNSAGVFKLIATVDNNLYVDQKLADAKDYTYKVKAYVATENGMLAGADSAELTAATRPVAPETVKLSTKDGKVKLVWSKNKRADYYNVYQYTGGSAYQKIATVTTNSLLVRRLTPGTTVYYKIQAVKTVGDKTFASTLTKREKIKVQ